MKVELDPMVNNSPNKTTVLVTGGAGYIGSNLVQRLCNAGNIVLVVDNLSSGNIGNLPKEAIFIKGDLNDTELLRKTFLKNKIDTVFHFAARKSVAESTINPNLYMVENVENTSGLLEVMNEFRCDKMIFASTAAVYGDREVSESGYHESNTPLPTNPYGLSKLLAEQRIAEATKYTSVKVLIFRFFNVALSESALDPFTGEDLLSALTESVLGIKEFSIFGKDYDTPDGTCYRDFIHISDLLDALEIGYKFLSNTNEKYTLLNLGSGSGISLNQIALLGSEILGEKFNYQRAPRRQGDIAYSLANISEVGAQLGWSPKFQPDDLFKTFFESLRRSIT